MAGMWATTSAANGVTKWHGRGHPQYDEAAATIGLDVRMTDESNSSRVAGLLGFLAAIVTA